MVVNPSRWRPGVIGVTLCLSLIPHPRDKRAWLPISSPHNVVAGNAFMMLIGCLCSAFVTDGAKISALASFVQIFQWIFLIFVNHLINWYFYWKIFNLKNIRPCIFYHSQWLFVLLSGPVGWEQEVDCCRHLAFKIRAMYRQEEPCSSLQGERKQKMCLKRKT